MILLVSAAYALTLEEAVARARDVNQYAVAADLEWKKLKMEAAEAWSLRTITPEISWERRMGAGAIAEEGQVQVDVTLLDAAGWLDAAEQSAQARSARYVSDATALDAQYAAAVLYVEAVAAEGLRDAARQYHEEAERTLTATRARVDAGLDSPLMLRSAEVQSIDAGARLKRAESLVKNARTRLARAIGGEVDALVPPDIQPPPAEPARSPWIRAQHELTAAARFEHAQSWAELLPVAGLRAESPLGMDAWTLSLQATWTIDGIGPVLRARASALAVKQSQVLAEGLQLDHDVAVETGREDARALAEVVESARARETLAAEALAVGQARLAVGLLDTLDVIELQEDVVRAREDRVEAELEQAYAVLEARRLAGMGW